MGFSFKFVEKAGADWETYKGIKEAIKLMKGGNAYVKAGVVGNKAGSAHGPNLTNASLAAIQEYGTETIPARSFIREPFDNNKAKYLKALNELLPEMMKKGAKGVEWGLKILGLAMSTDMKKAIREGEGIPPPLAPATI